VSKYLTFIEQVQQPLAHKMKTKIYEVYNKVYNENLGVIKWFPQWRKYCYFSSNALVFDSSCLGDIKDFIDKLMKERK